MAIKRITLRHYYIRETRMQVRHANNDGREWSKFYPTTPASLARVAELCNSDLVDVYHYVEKDGRIGMEIYRRSKRIR